MSDDEKRLHPSPPKPDETGFETVHFADSQVIFQEGEVGDAAYLISLGKVEIRKGMKTSNPQTLAVLGHGDIFGEMALFDDSPRMAEAIARSNVELIAINREEFNRRLDASDPVMRTISLYLVNRVRDMANQFMRRKEPVWTK
ncbi:cyclic nucleotide-binding domain-containing protein [Pseudomonadota bacterium]